VLSRVLAALTDGVVGPEMVEMLIDVCDVLEPDVAVAVADQVLTALAAGRCPDASAVRVRARRAAVRLAPGSARQRAQRATADRDVRWWAGPDGTGTVELTGPAAKVRAALGAIRDRATLLRHTDAAAGVSVRTAAQSRFDAGIELLLGGGTNHSLDNGGSTGSGLAGVLVHVPLAVALGLSEEPAELQGYGPLTAPAAREVIEDGARLWPVWVHPASGEPLGVADRPVQPGRDPAAIRAALLAMRTQADQLARAGALPHQPRHPHDHQGSEPPAPTRLAEGTGRSVRCELPECDQQTAGGGAHRLPAGTADGPSRADRRRHHRCGGGRHPTGTAGPYRVPARMRRYLQVRGPQCEWPGCNARAVHCDQDHDQPWPAGPTCPCNLGALCRHHHRCKQAGWAKHRLTDGGVRWTSPTGATYQHHPDHPPPIPVTGTLPALPAPFRTALETDNDAHQRHPDIGPYPATPRDHQPEDEGCWLEHLDQLDPDTISWRLLDEPDWEPDWHGALPLRRHHRRPAA